MATTTELGLLSLTHLHNLTTTQQSHHNNQNTQHPIPHHFNHPNHHHHQSLVSNPNIDTNIDTNTTTIDPANTSTSIVASGTTTTTTTSGNNYHSSTSGASWMWNPRGHLAAAAADEDSWEVRAFAEDTGSVMGTTWPPRSYTCAFCRREFRSAQALGGHMNVHRRDRARLHHHHFPPSNSAPSSSSPTLGGGGSEGGHLSSSPSFLFPAAAGEFTPSASSGGLCLLYQFQNPNHHHVAAPPLPPMSSFLSVSPYRQLPADLNFPAGGEGDVRISRRDGRQVIRTEELAESTTESSGGEEELDLELRLGHGPTPT